MCGHLWLRRPKPFRSSPASQQQGFTSLYPSVASESSGLGQALSPQWSRHSHVWPNLLKVAHDEQDIAAALPPLMPHQELAAAAGEDVPRLADPFGSQAGPSSLIGVPLNPTRDWDAAEKLLRCTLGGLQVLRLLGQLAVSRLNWPETRAGTILLLEAQAPAALLRICVLNSQLSYRPGVLCAACPSTFLSSAVGAYQGLLSLCQ